MAEQCVALKPDGSRCQADWALNADSLCAAHDPERRAARMVGVERSAATRKAKAERRRTLPAGLPRGKPKSLADCVVWSGWTARAVATGAIDNRAAEVIIKSVSTLLQSINMKDLEDRLYRAEQRAKAK